MYCNDVLSSTINITIVNRGEEVEVELSVSKLLEEYKFTLECINSIGNREYKHYDVKVSNGEPIQTSREFTETTFNVDIYEHNNEWKLNVD